MNAAAVIFMNFVPVDNKVAAVDDADSSANVIMDVVTGNGDVTGNGIFDSYSGHGVAVDVIVFNGNRILKASYVGAWWIRIPFYITHIKSNARCCIVVD